MPRITCASVPAGFTAGLGGADFGGSACAPTTTDINAVANPDAINRTVGPPAERILRASTCRQPGIARLKPCATICTRGAPLAPVAHRLHPWCTACTRGAPLAPV